ncbi:MAG: type II secretion system F family protein [Oligoflexia bacterium]|nr:type II secretion system F family protein [Oligoflexia bacterium]
MDSTVLLLIVVGAIAAGLTIFAFLGSGRSVFGGANVKSNIRNIVATQRQGVFGGPGAKQREASLYRTAEESKVEKVASSKLTLTKRLKYAQWSIPPLVYRVCQVGISLLAFSVMSLKFGIVLRAASLLAGPLFMSWLLNFCIDRRYKAFDADYPQFLLSLVGLLKTGMNPMQAIDAAGQSIEEGSILRNEVVLMNERLRFGVSEDKSIGSFGEDIYHPEIELFVQALLLSRRVGGNLSDTLDRLAKQVRKRQYFRASANAAVGMQRGSIWIIIGILVALEGYLLIVYPDAVRGAWRDELGWNVWQFGIIVILLGIFWVRQVTKIKV